MRVQYALSPVPVKDANGNDPLTGVMSIAAGGSHSLPQLAVKRDGTVWAWGLNNEGQIGNGEI